MIKEKDAPTKSFQNFDESLQELKEATSLTRKSKAQKLSTQVDLLARTQSGLAYVYERISELANAGIFDGSPWENPGKLVSPLVKGTLRSGHPNSTIELLSELRLVAISNGKMSHPKISSENAGSFLEEVIVHNLEFVFDELTEESREMMSSQEKRKVSNLFNLLIEHTGLETIKGSLAEEIHLICAQRPVVTRKVRRLIHLVKEKVDLTENTDVNNKLNYYVDAVNNPTDLASKHDEDSYADIIQTLSTEELKEEARQMGESMMSTGLCNTYMAIMFIEVLEKQPTVIPVLLGLSDNGKAEWLSYQQTITRIMKRLVNRHVYQCLYGLSRMLEKNLFSRRAVRSGLNNLGLTDIHPHIEKRIMKSVVHPHSDVTAKQYLMSSTIRILGQPLGVGQGNNATCQSARGISMWSQHAPAKLINMITTVATQNNLSFRFENHDLESMKLGKGLVDKLDYNLDAVSVILVTHLDKVYNEMMRIASGRTDDPHKWVNPAMYGQWIPVGFASCYNYMLQAIQDYKGFLRIFYAGFHPDYNNGRRMVYPNPTGIFITSNQGDMVGFHAVSLLRVKHDPESDEVRAYFLNPNNEGRQDWGQGIKPTVYGHGEKAGESSLPFYQFAARIYAFHYNKIEVLPRTKSVPDSEINRVDTLARESWGRSYMWNETPKQW